MLLEQVFCCLCIAVSLPAVSAWQCILKSKQGICKISMLISPSSKGSSCDTVSSIARLQTGLLARNRDDDNINNNLQGDDAEENDESFESALKVMKKVYNSLFFYGLDELYEEKIGTKYNKRRQSLSKKKNEVSGELPKSPFFTISESLGDFITDSKANDIPVKEKNKSESSIRRKSRRVSQGPKSIAVSEINDFDTLNNELSLLEKKLQVINVTQSVTSDDNELKLLSSQRDNVILDIKNLKVKLITAQAELLDKEKSL